MHVDANAKQTLGWGRALLGGCLLAATLLGTAGAYPLDVASIQAGDQSTVLRLETQGKYGQLPHEVFCLEEPFRVVVDIFGADAPVAVEAHPGGMVSEVRSSVWKDEPEGRVVRYVIETSEPVAYRTQTTSGALEILLEKPSAESTPPPEMAASSHEPGMASHESAGSSTPSAPSGKTSASHGSAENEAASAPTSESASTSPAGPPEDQMSAMSTHDGNAHDAIDQHSVSGALAEPALAAKPSSPATSPAKTTAAPKTKAAPAAQDPLSSSVAFAASQPDTKENDRIHDWTKPTADLAPSMGAADPRAHTFAPDNVPSGGAGRPMNLDVQNADVRTVFRSIAEFGGANIVADRDVTGPVSIRLVDVPWRQALDIVCQSAALVAIDDHGVIRVATLKTLAQEQLERESNARKREEFLPVEVHVFTVGYASATELMGSVRLILSDRGTVNADPRTNSLVVTDIPPRIEEVATLIRSLDTKTLQVEITAELVDMDASAVRRLGIDWDVQNLGDASEGTSLSGGVSEPLVDSSGQLRFGLIRSWGDLQAQLDAFEQTNDANIMSNPKITTVNNNPATILVGKEIPLITLDESGNAVTELKKVGITLRVTPFINAENKITMDLHPEISDLSSQATVQGGLIFTTSEALTRVMVDNGQTAVIGGLIRTNETKFEQGVPILRSIPILGSFFKTTDTVQEKRELVIFVTPRIVSDMASR
ncbi:MAG: hypothetical protein KC729_03365 [Candidatus Eisenbacteria bacterium]|uniref:Type IV pilus secretin PilQ n=1 Tax=Eiseniibacteriota bacterium TaxID=2212470 RepID=A0A956LYR3_UNCEI|nr:hypothetical protein [Candidatus Eisenbacteria bacterium]